MADIRVYTLDEVETILHVTRRSIYNYIKEGKLKAVKIGKFWRVTQENLEEFLSTGTKPATAAYRTEQGGGLDNDL